MTPDEYCQERAAKSGSSFYYSFLFLPPPRRRAITALYAFCREVDDVVDEIGDPESPRRSLAWWRSELERLFAGQPTHPVTRALQPHLAPFNLSRRQLIEIIDGMQMDLDQTRYLDYAGLRLYCRRVAGVVGELSASIFGHQDPQTLRYADAARAGVPADQHHPGRRRGRTQGPRLSARRGPAALRGFATHQILAARATDQESDSFRSMMREQVERARTHYRAAFALLPEVDRKPQRPGLIMAAIYLACSTRSSAISSGF